MSKLTRIQEVMKKLSKEQKAAIRQEAQKMHALIQLGEAKGDEQEKERLAERLLSGKAFWEAFRDEGEEGVRELAGLTWFLGINEARAWEDIYFHYCLLKKRVAGKAATKGHLILHKGGKDDVG